MSDVSIHPRAVAWKRDRESYSSNAGIIFLGASGVWHAQPGSHILDEDFPNWKAAARACEEYHGRRSRATAAI